MHYSTVIGCQTKMLDVLSQLYIIFLGKLLSVDSFGKLNFSMSWVTAKNLDFLSLTSNIFF